LLGYADDLEQATAMLREAMDADRYWPDAWFISDHSNLHRLTRGGRLSMAVVRFTASPRLFSGPREGHWGRGCPVASA
jgi:hypothetical protein